MTLTTIPLLYKLGAVAVAALVVYITNRRHVNN